MKMGILLFIALFLVCDSPPTAPDRALAASGADFVLVQQVIKPAISVTPTASYPNAPQAGNLLIAVLGTLHDTVVSVTPGWTLRIQPVTQGRVLYIYERIADGSATDSSIGFTLTSRDGTSLALFEFAAGPGVVIDAWGQSDTGPGPTGNATSVSTGVAENTIGTFAFAAIHRSEEHAEVSETIDDWTNGFVELVEFKCCGNVNRSRTAIAIKAVGPGSVETSASWITARKAAGAVVTYANGQGC